MTTVYLSSTFQDLKEYREEVLRYFRPLKDQFRMLNMEDYTAEDRSAYDKCMMDVRQCDLYILLLGKCYGSVARDPSDTGFNPEGYSYTELEYRMARQCGKEVWVFKASGQAVVPADADQNAFQRFWDSINGILSPRPFDAPKDLAIQVAQAVGRRFIRSERINEKLAYLCDRKIPNADFLLGRLQATTSFRRVIVRGPTPELCDNFINRLALFDLRFDERKLGNPISFDDFLSGRDYAANLQRFLLLLYGKLGIMPTAPLSLKQVFETQNSRGEIVVIALSCDAEMLEAGQIEFLKSLLLDCNQAAGGQEAYLFISLEEDPDSSDPLATEKLASEKAEILKALFPSQEQAAICVPRLEALTRKDIKDWIQERVTQDEGTAAQMMNDFFKDLPKTGITMQDAHERISFFIRKMNTNSPETAAYINLD
ncbi:MAG: DUF4062 domain-containing protein [Bacteroidetes bacterium]|nr:DUF4062 domain-containing protein [Bacteroidota bacterium]MBS1629985.1 DUF4062 domain-containing protein [Bacteroidota bacterium]